MKRKRHVYPPQSPAHRAEVSGRWGLRGVYGPVFSWRLGRSLGIDPVYAGGGRACSFDCIYCQADKTETLTDKRKIFVPTGEILKEIKYIPRFKVDYITFSGKTEPTLARNLGEIIKGVKKLRGKKIAVLTNSSLMGRPDVRKDLALADFVIAKLDAHSERLFRKINRPAAAVKLKNIVKGLKSFKKGFKGKFALQIMFMAESKKHAKEISELAREIGPDEIYVNTPTRPCGIKPLPKADIEKIKGFFKGMNVRGVYDTV